MSCSVKFAVLFYVKFFYEYQFIRGVRMFRVCTHCFHIWIQMFVDRHWMLTAYPRCRVIRPPGLRH